MAFPITEEQQHAIDELTAFLEEYSDTLLQCPANALDVVANVKFQQIANHFSPQPDDIDPELISSASEPEDEPEPRPRPRPNPNKRKRGEKGGQTSARWKSITAAKAADLALPNTIVALIGGSAIAFLTDKRGVGHGLTAVVPGEAAAEFFARVQYIPQLQALEDKHAPRWCFMMLAFYHFVTKRVKNGSSGGRIGANMKKTLKALLVRKVEGLLPPNVEGRPVSAQEIADNIDQWSKWGRNVAIVVQRFGDGSILHLSSKLTPFFVRARFTTSGIDFEAAMAHLEDLGLGRLAEESGANALGKRIRDYLEAPLLQL